MRVEEEHGLKVNIVSEGKCVCIYEPRGECGLEGYSLDMEYRFQRCEDAFGPYYRVYPGGDEHGARPDYYEVCGKNQFRKYFKVVLEHDAK